MFMAHHWITYDLIFSLQYSITYVKYLEVTNLDTTIKSSPKTRSDFDQNQEFFSDACRICTSAFIMQKVQGLIQLLYIIRVAAGLAAEFAETILSTSLSF